MPIWDVEPGDNSAAAGVARFYRDGQSPASGLALGSDGSVLAGGVPQGCWSGTASDQGLITEAYDPATLQAGSLLTNGTLYLTALPIRWPVTLNKLWYFVSAASVTPVAGQSWGGFYGPDGTLLAPAVGLDGQQTSIGPKSASLAAPLTVSAPFVWLGLVFNASTAPTLSRSSSSGSSHATGLSAALYRFCTNGSSLTALPASITPASNSLTGSLTIWGGAS